jgi:RNA polymerase sigma-70 factor, ECF subfamily
MACGEPSDDKLMLDAQTGSVQAFELIIRRYRSRIVHYLLSLRCDIELAEDITQETLVRVWVRRHRYAPCGKFESWLYTVAKRVMLSRLRQANRWSGSVDMDLAEVADERPASSPERSAISRDGVFYLTSRIDELPLNLAAVFTEVVIRGKTYAEAAAALAIPIGTIKSRMHEAVKQLRAMLHEEELL